MNNLHHMQISHVFEDAGSFLDPVSVRAPVMKGLYSPQSHPKWFFEVKISYFGIPRPKNGVSEIEEHSMLSVITTWFNVKSQVVFSIIMEVSGSFVVKIKTTLKGAQKGK